MLQQITGRPCTRLKGERRGEGMREEKRVGKMDGKRKGHKRGGKGRWVNGTEE